MGRWLPEDRYSTDQVPFNLREGNGKTYAEAGEKRIWLVGTKADCGKRMGTLQVTCSCANGDPKKPRHGQPKLTIVFRGQGEAVHSLFSPFRRSAQSCNLLLITAIFSYSTLPYLNPQEKESQTRRGQPTHKEVKVRFQPKAWFDDDLCEDYARDEFKEITAEARAAGRESVAIFDNLSGQTTEKHKYNLAKNKCKRHLLPGGMTDELQLVDDGVGYALKNEMGRAA